jgi:hypothetical protein
MQLSSYSIPIVVVGVDAIASKTPDETYTIDTAQEKLAAND